MLKVFDSSLMEDVYLKFDVEPLTLVEHPVTYG